MFIKKFDLGINIGEQWLPHKGLIEGANNDGLTEKASNVTEWLSSLPDVRSFMGVDEGNCIFGNTQLQCQTCC